MGKNIFSFFKFYWKILLSFIIFIGLIVGTIVVTLNNPTDVDQNSKNNKEKSLQLIETPSGKKEDNTQHSNVSPVNSASATTSDTGKASETTKTDETEKPKKYADDVASPAKQKDVSKQGIIVGKNDPDAVCKAISDYVEENSDNYTGISDTFVDITGTTSLWDNVPLYSYSSEDERYAKLERWTTDANDTSGNDSYPVVTAIIQNNGNSYIIHGLYVGETNFINDGQFPEEAWYK